MREGLRTSDVRPIGMVGLRGSVGVSHRLAFGYTEVTTRCQDGSMHLSAAAIRLVADGRSFQRGADYAREGRVTERRFTLRFLLEAVARRRGDTDALVSAYARELDLPLRPDRPEWADQRRAALDSFRASLEGMNGGFDPLVRALVAEGDLDAAWEFADEGGCTKATWRTPAERSVTSHPDRAATVLTAALDDIIAVKNKRAYAEAVEVMGTIRNCLVRAGREEAFAGLVTKVRAHHKPKRNLMALLDAAGW